MSVRTLMTPEELDAAAFGAGVSIDRRPEIGRAIEACYLPFRRAGYSMRDARVALAGFLANSWGGLPVVNDEAEAIAQATEAAETQVGGKA